MIKKIICLTDFSPASENAVNYAAKICQVLGTALELITVESVYLTGMIPGSYIEKKTLTTAEMMEYICEHIKTTFQIGCDFEIFVSNHSIAQTLKENKKGNHLIVMGTSSKQSLVKHWIGSKAYRFIKKTNYPLLMIPEHVSYHGINRVVFAGKDELNTQDFPINLIRDKVHPRFTALQVYATHKHPEGIKKTTTEEIHIQEKLFSRNTFKSIHAFMLYTQSDLLIVLDKRKGFLKNLFHASVIKKLSRQDCYPVLVIKKHDELQPRQ